MRKNKKNRIMYKAGCVQHDLLVQGPARAVCISFALMSILRSTGRKKRYIFTAF